MFQLFKYLPLSTLNDNSLDIKSMAVLKTIENVLQQTWDTILDRLNPIYQAILIKIKNLQPATGSHPKKVFFSNNF